jgi:O-antigen/teichoic acid export membrane protein
MASDSLTPVYSTEASESTYLLSHVLRGASSLYFGTIVQLAGRLVFAVIVARLVGADAVGIFTVGFVAVQALSMVATSGVEVGLYHFVSPAVRNGDLATVKGMFRASVSTTVVLALTLTALYVMLMPLYPLAEANVPEAKLALQLFAPTLVLQVFVAVLGSFALALGYPNVKVLAERVIGTAIQLITLVVLLAFGAGLMGVVLAYLGNVLAAAVLAVYLVWRVFPRQGHASALWLNVKRLYAFSYKQGLARIIGYPLMNANLFLLGYLSSPAQVGIYAAASRLTLVGLLFLDAFGQMQATLVASKQRETHFKDDYQRVTKWIMTSSAPLFVLIAAFAPAWMSFMGAEFVIGAPVLAILAFSQFVNMFTGSTALILAVRGRPGLVLLNTCLGWGTSAVLAGVLAADYGALGAAVAYFVAIMVIITLEATECRLVFGFYPIGRSILGPMTVIVLLVLVLFGLASVYAWSFIAAAVWSSLLLVAYAIAMWRLALQPADIEALKGMLKGWGARYRSLSDSEH